MLVRMTKAFYHHSVDTSDEVCGDAHQLEVDGQYDAREGQQGREQPAGGVQPGRQDGEPDGLVHPADAPLVRQGGHVHCVCAAMEYKRVST